MEQHPEINHNVVEEETTEFLEIQPTLAWTVIDKETKIPCRPDSINALYCSQAPGAENNALQLKLPITAGLESFNFSPKELRQLMER